MKYRIELTRRASRDLNGLLERIRADDSAAGANWLNGLEEAIHSLEQFPRRCSIARKGKISGRPLRHLLYGTKREVYRVIYDLDEARKVVRVRTVRHTAMDEFISGR